MEASHPKNEGEQTQQELLSIRKDLILLRTDTKIGDVVRLRKAHPCGSYEWEITRVGADIGIRCLKCQRRVLLERNAFERRLKEVVSQNG